MLCGFQARAGLSSRGRPGWQPRGGSPRFTEGRVRRARDHAAGTPSLASIHHPAWATCTELVLTIYCAGPGGRGSASPEGPAGAQVPGPLPAGSQQAPAQAWPAGRACSLCLVFRSGGSVPSHQIGRGTGSSPPSLRGVYVGGIRRDGVRRVLCCWSEHLHPASPVPIIPEPPVTVGRWGGLPQKGTACFALGSLWAPGRFGAQRAAARVRRASPCGTAGAEWVAGAQASPSGTCCPPAVASSLCLGAGSAVASVPPSLGSW